MKVYFFILFFCFIVLFLPLTVTAAPPAIDLNVSSTNINPGESILLDITVESNYRLSGNSVKIIWGEPGGTSVPCTMSVDYAAPPQTCNTSAWHTYNTEGDYTIQVTACSLLGCGIKKIDIHVDSAAPTPTPVDSYRNPLVWSDIPGFIWGAIMYIFGHAIVLLVLFILIGAYVLTTSGGSPQKIKLGKDIIIWAIIGYVIMLLARGIINLIWDFIKN
jgi:hypothetical protein